MPCAKTNLLAQCTPLAINFPYNQSFESGSGGWLSPLGHLFRLDVRCAIKNLIKQQAATGNNCWITGGLTGNFIMMENVHGCKVPVLISHLKTLYKF